MAMTKAPETTDSKRPWQAPSVTTQKVRVPSNLMACSPQQTCRDCGGELTCLAGTCEQGCGGEPASGS